MTYFQSLVWISLALCSALASSGCGQANASNGNADSDSTDTSDQQAGARRPLSDRYLRIPREFFERPVAAVIEIDAGSPAYDGAATWEELPPAESAPTGDFIADFRNFPGCAGFPGEGDLRVCFDIMPDVSNMGVNGEELSTRGLERWVARRAQGSSEDPACAELARKASFESGSKLDDSSFSATFRVEREAGDRCAAESRKVQFIFKQT